MLNIGTLMLMHVAQFAVPLPSSPDLQYCYVNNPTMCQILNFVHVILRTIPVNF